MPGSTTSSVGHASMGKRPRNGALDGCSVSISSQANRPACLRSASSVKTEARRKRQLCHQGAQASMNSGTWRARACASAAG